MAMAVLDWRHSAEGIVGPVFAVVDEEVPGSLAGVLEPGEQILVVDFFPIGSVEALNVGVLVRLAWLDILSRHAVGLGPLGERFTDEEELG